MSNPSWPASAYPDGKAPKPPGHRGHRLYRRERVGNFCGQRLHSEITRCASCGGTLVDVQQYPVARGQR